MKKLAAAFAAATAMFQPAQARPYDEILKEAQAAFAAEDFLKAGALLDEAQIERPYSLFLTRNRVLTRILTGRMDDAIALAKEVADRGIVLETPPNEAFDRMRAEPDFAPVAAQMAQNAKPIGTPVIEFELTQAGLLPEAIEESDGERFIGSVRTGAILKIRDGKAQEIARLDGGVFDVELRKGAIWAALNNQLAFENKSATPFAALVEIDRKTGSELKRRLLAAGPALVGDLEVSKKGRIFASDSLTPRIFEIAAQKDASVSEIRDARFANLQGIALDEKRGRLYVADYLTGLFAIDLKTRNVSKIANPTGAHLGGIDGLYLHEGDLIGVQNGASPQRIVKIDLEDAGLSALSLQVLQQALPEWNEPTHGHVSRDEFFYIATSNWPAYDDGGNPREGALLAPLRIMSIPLKAPEK